MKEKIIRASEGARLNVLGDNQLVKLTGKDTGGQLTTIIQHLAPGLEVPAHKHTNEDEHFYLIEGEVTFEVGNEKHSLKGGDMIFLPKHIPHSLKVTGDIPAKVYLNIVPSGLEEMFAELDKLPANEIDPAMVAEICGRYGVSFV